MVKTYQTWFQNAGLSRFRAWTYGTAGGNSNDPDNAFNNAPWSYFVERTGSYQALRDYLTQQVFVGCPLIGTSGSADGPNTWRADRGHLTRKTGKIDIGILQNAQTAFTFPDWARKNQVETLGTVHLNDFANLKLTYNSSRPSGRSADFRLK